MNHTLVIGTTGACCLAVISVVTVSNLRSLNETGNSATRLASVQASINDLQRLQNERPATLGTKEPGTGLSSQVSDALMRAGLPVTTMSSLTPDAEATLNSTLRKRSFRLSLQPVKLPELGRFLNDWRNHHPEWRAVSMQCTPQQIDPKQVTDRTSAVPAPISALIVFETVYAPSPKPAPSETTVRPVPANSAPLLR